MDLFVVQGGTPLAGEVRVSGSKNAALPIMAAALALKGRTLLRNVPDLVDVRTLGRLLESLGTEVVRQPDGNLEIEVRDEQTITAEYQLVRQMRASVCVLGPLLARRGHARVSLPGGCNIGNRPIDLHLKGLAALGASIEVRNGYVEAHADRLQGTNIYLAGPHGSTVTGTCNIMTAAALARGTTVIDAAACEPEVVALAEFLNTSGARIAGQGTPRLVIEGVDELRAVASQPFEIIPDRVEAATLLIAAAITRGEVSLKNVIPGHLSAVLEVLQQIGGEVKWCGKESPQSWLQPQCVSYVSRGDLSPIEISARPYPGIPTDVQAQFMALACTISGVSCVRDLVFPDRFMHVAELARMGAQIRQQDDTAILTGTKQLMGAHVMASDLRASAALVLAGLAAEGETTIRRIYHLDRGYERLERKLTQLGGTVHRVKDEDGFKVIRGEKTPPVPPSLPQPGRRSA